MIRPSMILPKSFSAPSIFDRIGAERSGERLPRAARRVSGSESINRIHKIMGKSVGVPLLFVRTPLLFARVAVFFLRTPVFFARMAVFFIRVAVLFTGRPMSFVGMPSLFVRISTLFCGAAQD